MDSILDDDLLSLKYLQYHAVFQAEEYLLRTRIRVLKAELLSHFVENKFSPLVHVHAANSACNRMIHHVVPASPKPHFYNIQNKLGEKKI